MAPTRPVLIPGNMCDARLWRGGGGFVIQALDRPGLSAPVDADTTRDASIAAMAARILSDTPGRLLPIGFSMGAIIAVEMWCQAPDRVAGMALLGYNATADLPERAAHRPLQQAEVRRGGLERVLVEELKPNYLAEQNRGNAALLALLRDMGLALGPDVFLQQSEALRCRADRCAALATITVPVLLACGAEDRLCPPAWHEDWAARITGARFEIVNGSGHMLPLEQPFMLADMLSRWLPLVQAPLERERT